VLEFPEKEFEKALLPLLAEGMNDTTAARFVSEAIKERCRKSARWGFKQAKKQMLEKVKKKLKEPKGYTESTWWENALNALFANHNLKLSTRKCRCGGKIWRDWRGRKRCEYCNELAEACSCEVTRLRHVEKERKEPKGYTESTWINGNWQGWNDCLTLLEGELK